MSRRMTPSGPDRTAQNQATLKSLVKLENNKSCADCKKNKHPRWASWNLGIFICIRCSGIHRGMGTHISRVKSVDLDSWTDEQLQSMLKWGNSKANKYWEAKLAPGHVPAEAKIENFIRTKYDSKRWVMDGPMPDPATLGTDGDDDVPLNVVQEKAKLERNPSLRNSTGSRGAPGTVSRPPPPASSIDLFGDETSTQARPSTTEPAMSARAPPPKATAAPPKQTKPGDSLLGLDFFGSSQNAPPQRPASVAGGINAPGGSQRTDLKQSILSLYASAPKPAAQPQQPSAFGGYAQPAPQQTNAQAFGGLGDAFSGLSFTSTPAQQPVAQQSSFASLASPRASVASPTSSLSGGSFFDTKPAAPKTNPAPPLKPATQRMSSGFGDFGDFTSAAPTTTTRSQPPPVATSSMGDLFDMSSPAPAPTSTAVPSYTSAAAPSYSTSAFNLSQPAAAPKPAPLSAAGFSNLNNMDAWGTTDAWNSTTSSSSTTTAPAAAAPRQSLTTTSSLASPTYRSSAAPAAVSRALSSDFGGWGSNDGAVLPTKTTIAEDDDFGGWSSAEPVTPGVATAPAASMMAPASGQMQQQQQQQQRGSGSGASGGFKQGGNSDDLFGNVWG